MTAKDIKSVPARKVIIRIKKEDRENIFSKIITRHDGSKTRLFLTVAPTDVTDNRNNEIYVSIGEVVLVGSEVKGVEVGDIALVDYTCDTSSELIIAIEDNGDRLYCIEGVTTFHKDDLWINASRKNPTDRPVWLKGDIDNQSPLLGIIRNDKIISRNGMCFIDHVNNKKMVVTNSGLEYEYDQKVVQHKLLAASEESIENYGLDLNREILVKEADVFSVKLPDNSYCQCVFDADILLLI